MNSENEDSEEANPYEENEPSAEELDEIRKATPEEASEVDALVLRQCGPHWRKVAMVVGKSLDEYDEKFPHLPYIYMQIRMLELVDRGALEAQGNVMAVRFSEVRIPSGNA